MVIALVPVVTVLIRVSLGPQMEEGAGPLCMMIPVLLGSGGMSMPCRISIGIRSLPVCREPLLIKSFGVRIEVQPGDLTPFSSPLVTLKVAEEILELDLTLRGSCSVLFRG